MSESELYKEEYAQAAWLIEISPKGEIGFIRPGSAAHRRVLESGCD